MHRWILLITVVLIGLISSFYTHPSASMAMIQKESTVINQDNERGVNRTDHRLKIDDNRGQLNERDDSGYRNPTPDGRQPTPSNLNLNRNEEYYFTPTRTNAGLYGRTGLPNLGWIAVLVVGVLGTLLFLIRRRPD